MILMVHDQNKVHNCNVPHHSLWCFMWNTTEHVILHPHASGHSRNMCHMIIRHIDSSSHHIICVDTATDRYIFHVLTCWNEVSYDVLCVLPTFWSTETLGLHIWFIACATVYVLIAPQQVMRHVAHLCVFDFLLIRRYEDCCNRRHLYVF